MIYHTKSFLNKSDIYFFKYINVTEKEKIGEECRKLREKISGLGSLDKPISQQELADINDGVTKELIGTIERGQANPTLEKMVLIAKSLKKETVTILDVEINVEKFIREMNK
ncbi:helix-turn-helix domain-containing protein [Flavobacterium notoginsengisoli]|uniref:helix-turn-helix domain-containing protein n=1 Tax=Flavobacterium notoginsengisoli TaxID=1478199 RepID=UPI003632F44F